MAVLGIKSEASLENGVLTVRFPKKTIVEAFTKPETQRLAENALEGIAPGTRIRFSTAESGGDSLAEQAKKAFGSKIEIVE